MSAQTIRELFVNYYGKMGFQLLPSAPIIDPSIPMSFVMSAGLIQVEKSLAKLEASNTDQYVLVQKCFRHFDLEKVGTDDYHLSMFEMPGAFIFGKDGRLRTISKMWELATSVLNLSKENLWVTYFIGDNVLNNSLPADLETRKIWLDVGVQKDKLIGLSASNNYWMQGKGIEDRSIIRKCGPNTELFYDRGEHKACSIKCAPGCTCGRFIEFSNSLFIEAFVSENDTIYPLKDPFNETVIGVERVNMIKENTDSIFETKEFTPILRLIREFADPKYEITQAITTSSERIVADHLRALFFLVANGAPPPGKNGRERIVKLLIRRIAASLIVLGIESKDFIPTATNYFARYFSSETPHSLLTEKLNIYYFDESERFARTINRALIQLSRLVKEGRSNSLTESEFLDLQENWGLPKILTSLFLQRHHENLIQQTTFANVV